MGEPLLNLPSVLRAHDILNKDLGIGGWGAALAAPKLCLGPWDCSLAGLLSLACFCLF